MQPYVGKLNNVQGVLERSRVWLVGLTEANQTSSVKFVVRGQFEVLKLTLKIGRSQKRLELTKKNMKPNHALPDPMMPPNIRRCASSRNLL